LKSVICYLIINQITNLPEIAITSALKNTQCEIYIGYLDKNDLHDLPNNKRLHFIDLSSAALTRGLISSSTGYIDFSNDYFFQLVQLKWDLFEEVLNQGGADFIVYLDLDVVVLKDLASEFNEVFKGNPQVEVLIQDFTFLPSSPRLCMGVFAFRCKESTLSIIKECSDIHASGLLKNSRYGDDDVITQFFVSDSRAASIRLLPQQSFPVGNLFNLLLPISPLRGLRPEIPFIFHANFVVGNLKKTLLLTLVLVKIEKKYLLKAMQLYLLLPFSIAQTRIASIQKKFKRGVE
jgi:hypothetical protein